MTRFEKRWAAPLINPISFNPIFFATQSTALKVAQMVGGIAVQSNQFTPNGGPFQQLQANWIKPD